MKKNSIVLATLLMCTGSALAGTGTSSAISTQELAGVDNCIKKHCLL